MFICVSYPEVALGFIMNKRKDGLGQRSQKHSTASPFYSQLPRNDLKNVRCKSVTGRSSSRGPEIEESLKETINQSPKHIRERTCRQGQQHQGTASRPQARDAGHVCDVQTLHPLLSSRCAAVRAPEWGEQEGTGT